MDARKISIDDAIKELGLPEGAKFVGYVVHLPVEDEFLAFVQETSSMVQRAFCKTPEDAKVYQNHKKAIKDAKHCKQKAIVCLLFDTGNQLAVADARL